MRPRIFTNRKVAYRGATSSNKTDYVIFDFEALGLKVHTDQPTQAGFVILEEGLATTERLSIDIKRNIYSVPGPVALEITSMAPEDLDEHQRLSEFEAAQRTSSILGGNRGHGIRVFAGYNSLSYDEQLLRYFLFRNFQYPYVTSGSSSRKFDLFHAVKFLHFVRPGLIKPGVDENGDVSWKLENVILANEIEIGKSHDALADSIMTADLLKKFKDVAPDVLTSLVEMSNKNKVSTRLSNLVGRAEFTYLFTHYAQAEVKPLMPVVLDEKGGTLAIDLSKDPDGWINMSPKELFDAGGAYGEDAVFRVIRPASCPYLFDVDDKIISDGLAHGDLDPAVLAARAERLNTSEIREKMAQLAKLIEEGRKSKFLKDEIVEEETLYGGQFPDKNVSRQFCSAQSWEERAAIIENMTDPRLREFGNRLLSMHGPEEIQTKESLVSLRRQIMLRLEGGLEEAMVMTTMADARGQLDDLKDDEVRVRCSSYLDRLEVDLRKKVSEIDKKLSDDAEPDVQLRLF